MPLMYLDQSAAEKAYGKELGGWMKQKIKYRGCYSAQKTEAEFNRVKLWSHQSDTAFTIFEKLKYATTEIDVVGMSGGYQCFGNAEGVAKRPVIFVDLDAKIDFRVEEIGRRPHQLGYLKHLSKLTKEGPPPYKWVEVSNNIALLHEMGHAKQFLETPDMFASKVDPRIRPDEFNAMISIGAVPKDRVLMAAKKLLVPPKHKGPVSDSKAQAVALLGNLVAKGELTLEQIFVASRGGAVLPDANDTNDIAGADMAHRVQEAEDHQKRRPSWSVKIEMDNMSRHEWKICDEMRLPRRSDYSGIRGTSNAGDTALEKSLFIKTVEKGMEAEIQAEARKQKELELEAAARKARVKPTCPNCGAKQGNAMALRFHVASCSG